MTSPLTIGPPCLAKAREPPKEKRKTPVREAPKIIQVEEGGIDFLLKVLPDSERKKGKLHEKKNSKP